MPDEPLTVSLCPICEEMVSQSFVTGIYYCRDHREVVPTLAGVPEYQSSLIRREALYWGGQKAVAEANKREIEAETEARKKEEAAIEYNNKKPPDAPALTQRQIAERFFRCHL